MTLGRPHAFAGFRPDKIPTPARESMAPNAVNRFSQENGVSALLPNVYAQDHKGGLMARQQALKNKAFLG